MKKVFAFGWCLILFTACHNTESNEPEPSATAGPASLGYSVLQMYPHDTSSFTEGLEWHDSILYESTGDPGYTGKSKLIATSLKEGKEIRKVNLSKEYFGEGITILNGKIYQLTYVEHKCFVYDQQTFNKTGELSYEGQGWGMTNNGKELIMDSGSNVLLYRDPATLKITKSVPVIGVPHSPGGGEVFINELEYVDGFIYANVWQTNYILKIDPATGKIVAQADLTELVNQNVPETETDNAVGKGACLNGIAYNTATKTFYITGKLWPKIFEIRFN